MTATFIALGVPLTFAAQVFSSGRHHLTMTATTWVLAGVNETICLALCIPLYYVFGPNDLFINLDRRTYRRVYGWPHRPKVQTGPMDDMDGIYVCRRRRTPKYWVGIVWRTEWKPGTKRFFVLDQINDADRADRFARETAATLDLPIVEPPKMFR